MTAEASIGDNARQLLEIVGILYPLVSGLFLKFALERTGGSAYEEFDRSSSVLALCSAAAALVVQAITLMLTTSTAFEAMGNRGDTEAILVAFVVVWLVLVGLAIAAAFAIGRAGKLLWHFRKELI